MKHSRNGTYSHTRVHLIKSVFDHLFDHLYNNIYLGGHKPISAAKAAGLGKSDKYVDGICQMICGGRCQPLSSFKHSPFTTGTFQGKGVLSLCQGSGGQTGSFLKTFPS